MKIPFYLIVSSGGSVRTVKSKPNLAFDEISIKVDLELPNALFQKPQLAAAIKIPDEAAVPQQIDAVVLEDAKQAIQQATGLEVKISLIPQNDNA